MSLYKRSDSPHWWVKISHGGRTIQRSTGTQDKSQAQEYHDKLKASLWEQQRLGIKPRRSWKEAVVRWLAETSEKITHREDVRKLRWLDAHLGDLMLDDITRDIIDRIKAEKLKMAGKPTVNRYLALVRASSFGRATSGNGSTRCRRLSCIGKAQVANAQSQSSRPKRCCGSYPRISATSCCSRSRPAYGSRMSSAWNGHTSTSRPRTHGSARTSPRTASRSRYR